MDPLTSTSDPAPASLRDVVVYGTDSCRAGSAAPPSMLNGTPSTTDRSAVLPTGSSDTSTATPSAFSADTTPAPRLDPPTSTSTTGNRPLPSTPDRSALMLKPGALLAPVCPTLQLTLITSPASTDVPSTGTHTGPALSSRSGAPTTSPYPADDTADPPLVLPALSRPTLLSVATAVTTSPGTSPATSRTDSDTVRSTVSPTLLSVSAFTSVPSGTVTLVPSPDTTAPAATPPRPPDTSLATPPLPDTPDTPAITTGDVPLVHPDKSTVTDAPLVVPSGTPTLTDTSTALPGNTCRGTALPLDAAVTASRPPSVADALGVAVKIVVVWGVDA